LTTDSSKVKHQAEQHKMWTQMPIAEMPIAAIFVMCGMREDFLHNDQAAPSARQAVRPQPEVGRGREYIEGSRELARDQSQ
jgi:hypothetical protein